MNLLSPFVPQASGVVPGMRGVIDATGGQYEGFNYLGLGLLLASVFVLPAEAHWLSRNARRHLALLIACAALLAFAISHRVFVGDWLVATLPMPLKPVLGIFRSSGRFFWLIGYAQIAVVLVLAFRSGRALDRSLRIGRRDPPTRRCKAAARAYRCQHCRRTRAAGTRRQPSCSPRQRGPVCRGRAQLSMQRQYETGLRQYAADAGGGAGGCPHQHRLSRAAKLRAWLTGRAGVVVACDDADRATAPLRVLQAGDRVGPARRSRG